MAALDGDQISFLYREEATGATGDLSPEGDIPFS